MVTDPQFWSVPGPVMSSPLTCGYPVNAPLISRNLRVSPLTVPSTAPLFCPPVARSVDVPTTLAPFCSRVRARPPPPGPVVLWMLPSHIPVTSTVTSVWSIQSFSSARGTAEHRQRHYQGGHRPREGHGITL